jgi:hypothetical protein
MRDGLIGLGYVPGQADILVESLSEPGRLSVLSAPPDLLPVVRDNLAKLLKPMAVIEWAGGDLDVEPLRGALARILSLGKGLIMIYGLRDEACYDLIGRLRRAGLNVFLLLATNDPVGGLVEARLPQGFLEDACVGWHWVLPRLCSACRIVKPVSEIDPAVIAQMRDVLAMDPGEHLYFANHDGCPQCRHGHAGPVFLPELARIDAGFVSLLHKGDVEEATVYWRTLLGVLPVSVMALLKMADGLIDPRALVLLQP